MRNMPDKKSSIPMHAGEVVKLGIWQDPDGRQLPIWRFRTVREVLANILYQKSLKQNETDKGE